MQSHFRRLGLLRKEIEALRLGNISFFEAGDKRLGYRRQYKDKSYRIYVNRSGDPWDIPSGKMVYGTNMQLLSTDGLTIAPRGFCIVEE